MSVTNKYLIEGLDRLGKDTLINGIQHKRGFHHVLHFSKPVHLDCYQACPTGMSAREMDASSWHEYQERSFRNMFELLEGRHTKLIMNRAHLGECVYAPLYRGYSGDYVFKLERDYRADVMENTRLILLVEDFEIAKHFVDDGLSLGAVTARETEQALFIDAFEKSIFKDKRLICVTDPALGGFKPKDWILNEALG
jgi:hypothetical protein